MARCRCSRKPLRRFPFVERIFADGAYQGAATAAAVRALGKWELEIVKRSDQAVGFEVLPKRWLVERTHAWLNRFRRLLVRWARKVSNYEAVLHFACALFCLRAAKAA
jgi:transposase